MGRAILAFSGSAAALLPRPFAGLRLTLVEFWGELAKDLFDSYRPELHYMRGRGPKWHAKHASQD